MMMMMIVVGYGAGRHGLPCGVVSAGYDRVAVHHSCACVKQRVAFIFRALPFIFSAEK
jgi:hypothetical protein